MNYIAVDPGKGGGIAWNINSEVGATGMGDETVVVEQLRSLFAKANLDVTVIVEDVPKYVGPIPGSAAAVLFKNFGVVTGCTLALCAKMVMVKPHDWQKFFRLGTKKQCSGTTEWKNKLKAEASRRFPKFIVTLKTADSLLMLEWARLTNQ